MRYILERVNNSLFFSNSLGHTCEKIFIIFTQLSVFIISQDIFNGPKLCCEGITSIYGATSNNL